MLAVLPGVALAMLHSTALDMPRADVIDAIDSDHYRIQWIMGSYLLGAAAGMALTRFASDRLGLRGAYLLGLVGFTVAAGTCGLVSEVIWMAPLRLGQGLGMGLLISAGMLMLWRAFPQHRELAMALYGMAVYLPALAGAILGGMLTAWYSWRWIFFLNWPLGAWIAATAWRVLPDDRDRLPERPAPFDLIGFTLLLAWIITMSVVLDMGQYWGWVNSPYFVPWLVGLVLAFAGFVGWGIFAAQPLIDLRPFGLRNFGLGVAVKALFSINLYVLIGMLAGYMIGLRSYQWWQSGLVLLPGLITMTAAILGGIAIGTNRNRRPRMLLGLAVMIVATWQFASIDLYTSKEWQAVWWGVWGAGAGLIVGPVMLTAFEDLTPEQTLKTAGSFNIMRALPAYIAGSLLVTLHTQHSDAQFDVLRQNIRFNRPVVEDAFRQPEHYFTDKGSGRTEGGRQAHALLGKWLRANARAFAYQNVLQWLAVLTAVGVLLLFFIHPPGEDSPAEDLRE